MGGLRYNGTLSKIIIAVAKLFLLNFYWVIGCLPILTIGPATIAAFSVLLRFVETKEISQNMTKDFWMAVKKNFFHGAILSICILLAAYSSWLYYQLALSGAVNLGIPAGALLVVLFLLAVPHLLYVFPLEARYRNRLLISLGNSRYFFFSHPVQSLCTCLALALEAYLFLGISWRLFSIGVFIAPVLMMLTVSFVALPLFRKCE